MFFPVLSQNWQRREWFSSYIRGRTNKETGLEVANTRCFGLWCSAITGRDSGKLNKKVKRVSSVLDCTLESFQQVQQADIHHGQHLLTPAWDCDTKQLVQQQTYTYSVVYLFIIFWLTYLFLIAVYLRLACSLYISSRSFTHHCTSCYIFDCLCIYGYFVHIASQHTCSSPILLYVIKVYSVYNLTNSICNLYPYVCIHVCGYICVYI